MADSDSVDRGSNPRLPVGFFRSVAQRQKRLSYKEDVVGSIPTAPIKSFGVVAKLARRWSCKPVIAGSIPVNSIFQDVGQRLPTCLGSKLTQVRILPS